MEFLRTEDKKSVPARCDRATGTIHFARLPTPSRDPRHSLGATKELFRSRLFQSIAPRDATRRDVSILERFRVALFPGSGFASRNLRKIPVFSFFARLRRHITVVGSPEFQGNRFAEAKRSARLKHHGGASASKDLSGDRFPFYHAPRSR